MVDRISIQWIYESLASLFSPDGFVPRRVCGLWPDWLVREHVVGNGLVFLAYFAMPLMIWRLGVRKKEEWAQFSGVVRSFALFIALCGLGHFLDMLAFFRPMYRLSGHVLMATGLISCWTAWSLRRAWPVIVALRSPAELERLIEERTSELTRTVAELERAEDDRSYLATIVESSSDAIVGKDLEGVVTSWNGGAARLFGYSAAEVIGRPIGFLIPFDRIDEEKTILERLRRGELVPHFDSVRLSKEGRLIDVSLAISSITDRTGRIVGISKIARDITQGKQIEDELRRARDEAMAATRLKSDFMATMSHEIRTPMNGVIGMADLLQDTALNDFQRDCLKAIRGSGDALMVIIDDILDFSKMQARKLKLVADDFDLGAITEEVAFLLAPRARQKGLEIRCRIDPEVPDRLVGDPARIRQVLTNLAGNAVKFTDLGVVDIELTLVAEDEDHATLRIEVRDSGIGIPAGRQAEIFESFTQIDGGISRRNGGTGLGLAICRELVGLMGGQLGLESRPGVGSTFWVELTLVKGVHTLEAAADRLGHVRVLIAVDRESDGVILRESLLSWGCRPEVTSSGPEAIARLLDESGDDPYGLILLDQDMPALSGEQTARVIKAMPRHARVPLVTISSLGQAGSAVLDGALWAARVTRPVRRSQLHAILRQVSAEADETPILPQPPPEGPLKLPTPLRILLAEDNSINRRVATAMAEGLGCTVEAVYSGREAVEALDHDRHDLVLMDVQMPEMDGYAATALIRDRERAGGRHIPIIAMTAHAMEGDRERCLASGMDGYLTKPIRVGPLREALLAWSPGENAPLAGAGPSSHPRISVLLREATWRVVREQSGRHPRSPQADAE